MDLGVMKTECDCDSFMEFQIISKSRIFGGGVEGKLTIWGRKGQMGDRRGLIGEDGQRQMLKLSIEKLEMFTRNYPNF